MKTETVYVAFDGSRHDNEPECRGHELNLFNEWLVTAKGYHHLFQSLNDGIRRGITYPSESQSLAGKALQDLFIETAGELPIFAKNRHLVQ